MIPKYFVELAENSTEKKRWIKYFNDQYPETNSCIELDKQILSIQKDLDEIKQRELKKFKESPTGSFLAQALFAEIRTSSKKYLESMLIAKKNLVALADCRNKIETIRQEETAQVFTETSATAETRILSETKKKQYLLIGVGAVVVITSLIIFLNKRKA